MILTTIFNLFANLWIELFNLLPQLPNYPEQVKNVIQTFLNLVFQAGELILFFLPPFSICGILINLSIALEGFVIAYYLMVWILGKLPIINIH